MGNTLGGLHVQVVRVVLTLMNYEKKNSPEINTQSLLIFAIEVFPWIIVQHAQLRFQSSLCFCFGAYAP